tara:strand:- start:17548 stop:18681 length:1134 start_codon:yes stop_codon:yes gene_type:complete
MTRSGSRFRRVRRLIVCAILLSVLCAVGLWLLRDTQPVERARAQAIARFVESVSSSLAETAMDVRSGDRVTWRGVRRYNADTDAWASLDPLADIGPRAVVLIHGLDEPGGIWDELAPALAQEGHTVLRFDYANDQAVVRSADAFERALVDLRTRGLSEIDLVCHSMGGLVSREVLSRDGYLDRGVPVGTLITLGTPHKGSPWARMRSVAEAREQVQRWAESDDLDPKRLLGYFNDGEGQAGIDLMPDSAFLAQLNERSIPDGIRVVCVVGRTDTPSTLVGTLSNASARSVLRDIVGEKQSKRILSQVEALGAELGDGVVPVSSAVMDGATDVVIVNANHRGMIRTIEIEERVRAEANLPDAIEPPAIRVVLDRLRRE